MQSAYTIYQMHMLMRMMGNKSLFNGYHAMILGMDEGEDISDTDNVFLKYVSRVGDITPDHDVYDAVWMDEDVPNAIDNFCGGAKDR